MKQLIAISLLFLGVACGGVFDDPEVVSVDPGDGSMDVPVDVIITAIFTKSIAPPTVQTDSFILRLEGTESETGLPGTYDTNGTIVTLTPDEDLDADSDYEIILNDKIKDLDQKGLGNEVTARFSTAP